MRYLMGTFLRIEALHHGADAAERCLEEAFDEVRRIEGVLSRFREDSQIYMLNKSAHDSPQHIDIELFYLLEKCIEFSKRTGGAFDITIAPLTDLWRQAERKGILPEKDEIDYLLSQIGYQEIILDEDARTISFKNRHLKIDLGAAGKGYALDRAAAVLKKNGIEKAYLDFGGQISYIDESNSVEYVGIKNPLRPEEVMTSLPIKNQSISTSGSYERYFEVMERTYSHIIDPATGRPVDNCILSVNVIGESAMESDMFSTALFVLGLDAGSRLIEKSYGVKALFAVRENGKANFKKGGVEIRCVN
ncbi:MAG: FAD:protein FMN transferase [Candidatus Omnitrophica bacterium]|nr:FAD:protein FMN transferase [Candidatus Omnitrophota bacterium]